MTNSTLLTTATAGNKEVPSDWMPASQVRSLIFEDPAIIWLEYHGGLHGFRPDDSPYLAFIAEKSRQFEQKWIREIAPQVVVVCREPYEVRQVGKLEQTLSLMQRGVPVIAQPALWWAPERIYGVPDLIIRTSCLREHLPDLPLSTDAQPDPYVVLDMKFTTRLEESGKARDLKNYAAQVRLYSYMLGNLQDCMPGSAYLVTRDHVHDPLPVEILSTLHQPLDGDLAALRDQFIDIKVNGAQYLPWKDAVVASNIANTDDRWRTAKQVIANEKMPGKDAGLLYQIGPNAKRELSGMGYPSLTSILDSEPRDIPLEKIRGFGAKKASQIRAILQANRTQTSVMPPPAMLPAHKPFEFYVDYEYFTNLNVDFERQWPTLEGCEMVFMIGCGWEQDETWHFEPLIAAAENHEQERVIFERFIDNLISQSNGTFADPDRTAIYHWSSAEVWQTQRVVDRQQLDADHPLRKLPWVDLLKVFLDGPAALPGALDYGLKPVAKALGEFAPEFKPRWTEDCDEGQQVMVMGWNAYQTVNPLETQEMEKLTHYLEADCNALWNILRWLRVKR